MRPISRFGNKSKIRTVNKQIRQKHIKSRLDQKKEMVSSFLAPSRAQPQIRAKWLAHTRVHKTGPSANQWLIGQISDWLRVRVGVPSVRLSVSHTVVCAKPFFSQQAANISALFSNGSIGRPIGISFSVQFNPCLLYTSPSPRD